MLIVKLSNINMKLNIDLNIIKFKIMWILIWILILLGEKFESGRRV